MKIRRKYLFYALAFASAIIAASMTAVDATIIAGIITNPWTFGFSCFIVGIIITILLVLILSIPINGNSIGSKIIDPSFKRIRMIKREEVKYHILAGVGNATLTLGFFLLLSILGDPSVVLPFSQVVILYLLVIESIVEKNIPTLAEVQSSVIVTFGAILGSISLTGSINLESLAIVFLIINPSWVLLSIYQRKLKFIKIDNKPNDSINIRLWNVIFACVFITIFVLIYDIILGTKYFLGGITASIEHFNWVALSMSLAFFSYVFYIRALGIGKASVTQAVRSSSIIFAIPFSIMLSYFNIIPPFTTDPVMLLIKMIGIIIIILGIVSFALTLIKAYIFISIKTGYPIEKTMNQIWDIPGVTSVTATAGPYDFIVRIRTRTLVKGYERIIRRIEGIQGIKDYQWQSILKEWEDI
jgi:DNA-binding Lrp family transcriptional regulator